MRLPFGISCLKKDHFFRPELLLDEDDLDEELLEEDLLDEDRLLLADEELLELLFLVELLLLDLTGFFGLEERDFDVELLFLVLVEDFGAGVLFLLSLLVVVPERRLVVVERRSLLFSGVFLSAAVLLVLVPEAGE